jgi:hypothetical protein
VDVAVCLLHSLGTKALLLESRGRREIEGNPSDIPPVSASTVKRGLCGKKAWAPSASFAVCSKVPPLHASRTRQNASACAEDIAKCRYLPAGSPSSRCGSRLLG